MPRHLLLLGAIAALTCGPMGRVEAQHGSPPEPDSGSVVCAPGVYASTVIHCLSIGPSAYLTELASLGITVPLSPLPASRIDRSLADLPFRYFHVISEKPVTTGSSPGDAGGPALLPGFVYIGYVDRVDTGSGIYYLSQTAGWVPGRGEQVGEISSFRGLQFRFTPRSSFGWSFEDIPIRSGPSYRSPETGRRLLPFTVTPIFGTEQNDGADWNMIGQDMWVEARKVAQVAINATPPDGASGATRWIDVDLAEQVLAVYQDNQLLFATMIASGVEPFWTRPGTFQITRKVESEAMRNNDPSDFYYLDDVPWTMYFDGPRALHGAYWRTRFGYPQSHGCVNLSVGDAHWLFNWAHEGDWVYVHDPTGKTPTDPALYKGGAY